MIVTIEHGAAFIFGAVMAYFIIAGLAMIAFGVARIFGGTDAWEKIVAVIVALAGIIIAGTFGLAVINIFIATK